MVSSDVLKFFFDLLYKESGLILDNSKKYLIESRLEPLAIQEGFKSIDELGRKMMRQRNSLLQQKIVDTMTTNETSFFRDRTPFMIMKDEVIPNLVKSKAKNRQIRIWCAASSTGQEPYSIAMVLSEMAPQLRGWSVKMVATDIAQHVLDKAKKGVYTQHEVQRGLSTPYMIRFLTQSGMNWEIKPELKRMITFRKLNLLSSLASIGQVDIIFCRNILIYFDVKTKKTVIERMTKVLNPGGILFLGGSETLLGISAHLKRVSAGGVTKGSYYQRNGVPKG